MLSDTERSYVVELLLEGAGTQDSPRLWLLAPFVTTTLPGQVGQGTPNQLVPEVLTLCLRDEWNNNPTYLSLLLQLLPPDELNSKLADIRRRISVAPPPAPDPLASRILDTGMPFLDRSELREQLRFLAQQAANLQPILVVSGPARSGKSYSTEYIDHFSYRQKISQITTYRYSLKKEDGLQTDGFSVARRLVSLMGRPLTDVPPPLANHERLASALAEWVLNNAMQVSATGGHWFVLDNFREPLLRDDTLQFVIALCDLVTNGQFKNRCRLILIGFDPSLLTVATERFREENINGMPKTELVACLGEILAPTPVPTKDVLPYITKDLPAGAKKLEEVNLRLRALMRATKEIGRIVRSLPDADFDELLLAVIADLPSGPERFDELKRRLDSLRESVEEL